MERILSSQRLAQWTVLCCMISTLAASSLNVGINEPGCQHKGDVLFCDYQNVAHEVVSMKPLQEGNLNKIFMYNLKQLKISKEICIDISLYKVKNAIMDEGAENGCSKTVEYAAKQCTIDRISGNIKSLVLEECKVKSLLINSTLSKLSIIDSEIEEFTVPSLLSGTSAIIKDSKILKFQKMVVHNESSLQIEKSTLFISDNGLDIRNGRVSIKDSTTITQDGRVILSSGGIMTVANLQGDMTVFAEPCICTRKLEITQDISSQSNIFIILFCICLVLLLISWIAIAFLVFKKKDIILKIMGVDASVIKNEKRKLESEEGCKDEAEKEPFGKDETDTANENGNHSKTDDKIDLINESDPEKNLEEHSQEFDAITKIAADIKSSFEERNRKYKDDDGKFAKEIKNIKDVEAEINKRFERIKCRYQFISFLQDKEISALSKFAEAQWNFNRPDKKKTEQALRKLNSSENFSISKSFLDENNKNLLGMLSVLSKPLKETDYKNILQVSDEELVYFTKLADKLKDDTYKPKKALELTAKAIANHNTKFHVSLQRQYELELRHNISRLEMLLLYIVGILLDSKNTSS